MNPCEVLATADRVVCVKTDGTLAEYNGTPDAWTVVGCNAGSPNLNPTSSGEMGTEPNHKLELTPTITLSLITLSQKH